MYTCEDLVDPRNVLQNEHLFANIDVDAAEICTSRYRQLSSSKWLISDILCALGVLSHLAIHVDAVEQDLARAQRLACLG